MGLGTNSQLFRFLHSSDLHLGKRFGNLAEGLRGRLREARHGSIERLAARGREHGAEVVLLAGDTFDTETPAPDIRRQALAEMGHHAPLRWVILPGNHDSLQAAQLWTALRADLPDNVILATDPVQIALAPGVVLLPAPCTTRRPGRDLTEWMDAAATPEGAIRLGLAHGPIRSFSEDTIASDILAPDRARRAGLDYLALGDWHGAVAIDVRTQYSGTPEPERFKHDKPGQALVVSVEAPGAVPIVTPVETGLFTWKTETLDLLPNIDCEAALAAILPQARLRRRTLLRISATGRTGIAGRTSLAAAIEAAAPDYALLELDETGLSTECDATELDRIDRTGALRDAAEVLLAQVSDENRTEADRAVARGALVRLFSYCAAASS